MSQTQTFRGKMNQQPLYRSEASKPYIDTPNEPMSSRPISILSGHVTPREVEQLIQSMNQVSNTIEVSKNNQEKL